MKLINIISCTLTLFFLFGNIQAKEAYFTDKPCLSPDGKTIVFAYESDLWKVPTQGGEPIRLTNMDGVESFPEISPDGKWLAFTSQQYGNSDIFIMPINGGEIRQLTFHSARDKMQGWSWDSDTIYFTSNRENQERAFSISRKGGTPKRFSAHYFNREHNLAVHPDGRFFFNESWESSRFLNRKRYKGAYNPNIKSYHPKTGAYKEYTVYEGKDVEPTIDQKGNIYFSSDEYNNELNLYQLTDSGKKRLTSFKESIYHPSVSADGSKIVFRKGYQIWVYDVATQKSKKVNIQMTKNNTLQQAQDFKVGGEITNFAVASDNKKMAFVARGELFVSDIKGKFVKQIQTRADGRVMEVFWLDGDKELIFNQTVKGYQNWFTISADGTGKEKQITFDEKNNRNLALNNDKTQAIYFSGREEVRLLDLKTMNSKLLTKKELWGFRNATPSWAADDKHVVFEARHNFESDIYLLNVETGKTENLTQSGVPEVAAAFSPDSKHLYFISNRTQTSYPRGLKDGRIYRVALVREDEPFRADKFDDLFKEEEKKEDEDKDKDKKKDKKEKEDEKKEKPKFEIETADLMKRLENMGPRFGRQVFFKVIQKDETTTLLFASNHDEGKFALWKKVMTPFEESKTEKITDVNWGFDVVSAGDKHYLLQGGNISTLDITGKSAKKIDINHTFQRNLKDEFHQMFEETWANLNENFYNETFHGIDWKAKKIQYQAYLKHAKSRRDVRKILNDMLGELNTSHVAFYSSGKEEDLYFKTTSNEVGIIFDTNNPYQVQRVITDSPADMKSKDIQKGDILLAVDGVKVDNKANRNQYFVSPSRKKEMKLTFRRAGKDRDVMFRPVSSGRISSLLYDEWQDERQALVDSWSNGKIAHVHMKNMGGGELNLFLEEMVTEANQKEALILDLRNNTGGNVHDDVLQFLSQKPYLNWKYREGKMSPQPHFAPSGKPIVLLINEQSLSDAEMTSAGFKQLGLGKIIGVETYRWIIFTTGKGLVDGSYYRIPAWGCYTLDGQNLEQTGVAPDIEVKNTFQDRMKGNDPQLKRAVEEILKDLK